MKNNGMTLQSQHLLYKNIKDINTHFHLKDENLQARSVEQQQKKMVL